MNEVLGCNFLLKFYVLSFLTRFGVITCRIYSNTPAARLAFQPKKNGGYKGEAGLCFQCLEIWFEDTISAKRKFLKMIVANKSNKYTI